MNAKDFLKAVWPASGNYCVAVPHTNQQGVRVYKHHVFDNMDDAYTHTRGIFQTTDVYFGIFTHHALGVMHPTYNRLMPSRKRENMDSAKTLFLDLDVDDKNKAKYRTQGDALAALARFIFRTGMPDPIVTSSGNGLHVYWPMSSALTADLWRPLAVNLRRLLDDHGVLYDPSRTLDITSVLRVPKTFNHKDLANLKEVKVIHDGVITDTDELAFKLAFLTRHLQPVYVAKPIAQVGSAAGVASNLSPHGHGFPPTDADEVASNCAQMRFARDNPTKTSQSLWFAMLGVIGFCTNGRKKAHEWSQPHPDYTPAETDTKFDQWQANGSVASCVKIERDGVAGLCQACPFYQGQFKNPIVITNKIPMLAAQAQQQAALLPAPAPAQNVNYIPLPICDPPYPYQRTQSFDVVRIDSKGLSIPVTSQLDLYPISVMSGMLSNGEQINFGLSKWISREHDAKGAITHHEFQISNQLLAEHVKLNAMLMACGVFVTGVPADVAKYMSAYLGELQRHTQRTFQHAHLGWPRLGEYAKFILNNVLIDAQGQTKACMLAPQTNIATKGMHKGGTLGNQVMALRFYNDPAYIAHQLAILASLSTPLFIATGQHGLVINLTGASGMSKTTALKAAAGMWGNPADFVVNGTPRGMSPMARDARAAAMPNLPTIIDEATLMEPQEIRSLVMSASQAQLRVTLKNDRTVREVKTDAHRAAPVIVSMNNSMHQLVNSINQAAGTAGSARVLELPCDLNAQIHTKVQADAFGRELDKNFGHIGEAFMCLAMPCIDQLFKSVEVLMDRLTKQLGVASSERFYIAAIAPCLVAGEFARFHGLLDWSMQDLLDGFINVQFPQARQTLSIEAERLSYANTMRDFLTDMTLDTISDDGTGNIPPANVRRSVAVHHRKDLGELWLHTTRLRDFCIERGVDYSHMLTELMKSGVVKSKDARRILGENTKFAVARARVVIVNATHPDIM